MKKLFKESISGHSINIFILFLFMVVQIIISLIIPVVLQKYIDKINIDIMVKLFVLVSVYFMLNLLIGLINVLITYLSENFGWNVLNRMRVGMLSKILDYDQHFYTLNSTGTIMEYVDRDINILSYFLNSKMLQAIINLGMIVGILAVLFSKSLVIGVIFLLYTAAAFFTIFRITKVDKEALDKFQEEVSKNIGKYGEWIGARKDIEALGEKNYISKKMKNMNENLKSAEISAQAYLYRIWSVTLLLISKKYGAV